MSPLHQWARFYAGQGWHIFPLVPGTKSPFKDSHGSSDATCDLAQIDLWWTANPDANIGVKPASAGLYVFDVDPRNGGSESFATLQVQHGVIDSPLAVDSPGGGFHLYFKADPDKRYSGAPATGIDGKFNGYAVLPPSLHPNGKRYAWRGEATAVAAAAPVWLSTGDRAPAPESVAFTGEASDLELIGRALAKRDPSEYFSWVNAIASVKHWQDHCPEAGTSGYELLREWSEQDSRHDDGQFDDKWTSFDSFRPGARTLGSLVHEAGITAAQTMVDAGAAFAALPVAEQVLAWSVAPVAGFKGPIDPAVVLSEMMAADRNEFCARWAAGNVPALIKDLAWRCGSCCELVLQVLALHEGYQGDSVPFRGMISHACASLTNWYTLGRLTDDQRSAELAGLEVRVEVDDGKLVPAFRHCLKALPLLGDVFQRQGQLVWVDPAGRMGPYDLHSLSHELETFLRFEKGAKGTPTKCPESLARRLLGHRHFEGVGEIAAAIPLPVVRADGSVIAHRGLDEQTGLYLLKETDRKPTVLDLAGIQAAFDRVWAPFAEFPFADDQSRGVFVAAMLTAVCRPALGTAPAFLINAQKFGSGKTLLSQCLMELACAGRRPAVLPTDEAEQAKTLSAIFLEAPRGILFDNVFGVIRGSGALCTALTSASYTARILGKSALVTLENRALCILNGNNVGLQGDVVRRILQVVLDSAEGVELQSHAFDPLEVVTAGVEGFRADLIDLITTYRAEGMPTPEGGLASFEAWNGLVRGCVQWLRGRVTLGLADPLDSLKQAQADDPQTLAHRCLQNAWLERFGLNGVTLRELTHGAFDAAMFPNWVEAYEGICTDKSGRVNPSKMAYWLRSAKRKKLEGYYFEGKTLARGVVEWSLKKV